MKIVALKHFAHLRRTTEIGEVIEESRSYAEHLIKKGMAEAYNPNKKAAKKNPKK